MSTCHFYNGKDLKVNNSKSETSYNGNFTISNFGIQNHCSYVYFFNVLYDVGLLTEADTSYF